MRIPDVSCRPHASQMQFAECRWQMRTTDPGRRKLIGYADPANTLPAAMARPLYLLVVFALVAAACSSTSASTTSTSAVTTTTEATTTQPTTPASTTTSTSTTTTPTTTTTTTVPVGPPSLLNGIPVADPALMDRRVMAIKMDNHPNARPQSGVQEADAVYELLVEGGHSRFILLFHHSDSEYVGPIRSGRPTDPGLIKPLDAPLVLSGAQSWVFRWFTDRNVNAIGDIGVGTFRISGRSAPHNLYGNTMELRGVADNRGYRDEPPAAPMFSFGEWPGGESATRLSLSWSEGNNLEWQWDGARWVRSVNDAVHEWRDAEGNGGEIAADTLIVLFAERYTVCPPAGASGSCVPALDTIETKPAWVLARGEIIEGTWRRDSMEDFFTLTDAAGDEIVLPPGIPWIHVFPDNRSAQWE